jgi:hypothetical protein
MQCGSNSGLGLRVGLRPLAKLLLPAVWLRPRLALRLLLRLLLQWSNAGLPFRAGLASLLRPRLGLRLLLRLLLHFTAPRSGLWVLLRALLWLLLRLFNL